MKSTEFKKIVNKKLAPFLRKENWKGSGFDYRKKVGNVIRLLTIQPSSSGGKFCIEIGIHFDFISLKTEKDLSKIKTWDVDIRNRLTPNESGDYWWDFPITEQIENSLFEEIKNLIFGKAELYFESYNDWDNETSKLSIEDIEKGNSKKIFPLPPLRSALMISRINLHLGRNEKAIEFAEYGLSKITGMKGSGLIPKFDEIKEKASR